MGKAIATHTVSQLRQFDKQQRRDSDQGLQPDLLGFSLGTPAFDTAPKVILRKNAGAVHSRSQLSCLERKLLNVCLYVAYDELKDENKKVHRVPLSVISTLAGFDSSKNTAYLKKAFRSLLSTVIEYSIIEERGAETWDACALLASVRFRAGMCEFEFPWSLRERLYQPERYARLDLAEMRNLSSVAAVALYENLVRYENMGRTPKFSVDLWRALLGADASTYEDFRRLSEKAIRPALKQVNEHTHITASAEYIRQNRRVVAIRFVISDKSRQLKIEDDAPDNGEGDADESGVVSQVEQRLLEEITLTPAQAAEVLQAHDEAHVVAVIDYVASRYLAGKVTGSLPAYFLATLPNFEDVPQESVLARRRRKGEQDQKQQDEQIKRMRGYREVFSGIWRSRAQQYLDGLSTQELKNVFEKFEAHLVADNNRVALLQWNSPARGTSPVIAGLLRNFVAEQFLPDREKAFAEWVQAQEDALAAA